MKNIKISVVIPVYNEEEFISQCLTALNNQNYPAGNFEVIVVDNNSTDNSTQIARQFSVKIVNQATGPVGAVRNAGAKVAKGRYLAFLDADCVVKPDWLNLGVEALDKDGAVYGGGCTAGPVPHWIDKAWLLQPKSAPKELLGSCIFIKTSIFTDIGGFDERITSGEDTKLSQSLKARNYEVKFKNQLNVIHLGNPVTLKQFFFRQIWHSENYIQNWHETIKDPTFYLLLIFNLSAILLLICIFAHSPSLVFVFLFITLALPVVLTTKRLLRSKRPAQHVAQIHAIYFLDLVYLVGRSAGIVKSLMRWARCILLPPANPQRDD